MSKRNDMDADDYPQRGERAKKHLDGKRKKADGRKKASQGTRLDKSGSRYDLKNVIARPDME